MTQQELLQGFEQLPIQEQLEMLRSALGIIESKFANTNTQEVEHKPKTNGADSLLAMAGMLSSSVTDVGERHDHYLGESLKDDHS